MRTTTLCDWIPRSLLRPAVFFIASLLLSQVNSSADQLVELAQKAGIQVLSEGDSSGDLLKKSRAAVPLNLLSDANRLRASQVLNNCNQYRRLPSLKYTIDEPIYRYLMQHPDVAVSTWRVMGISRFEMLQTGPMEYEAKAIDGSEGISDILYQDEKQTLFICDGSYHNVLLPKPLNAAALIWFRATYEPTDEGCHVVTQTVDVFVRFPSAGVSTIAKVLTPVTNGMMDRNLFEISLYGSMMSRAVRDEPEWVVQVAQQLDGVLPQRRGELADIARLPRQASGRTSANGKPVQSVDRKLIQSPQLLFFDPPKSGDGPESQSLEVKPASGGSIQVLPATRVSVLDESQEKPSRQSPSDDDIALQPSTPPAGPTASGPAGSAGKP